MTSISSIHVNPTKKATIAGRYQHPAATSTAANGDDGQEGQHRPLRRLGHPVEAEVGEAQRGPGVARGRPAVGHQPDSRDEADDPEGDPEHGKRGAVHAAGKPIHEGSGCWRRTVESTPNMDPRSQTLPRSFEMRLTSTARLGALAVTGALALAACGSDDDDAEHRHHRRGRDHCGRRDHGRAGHDGARHDVRQWGRDRRGEASRGHGLRRPGLGGLRRLGRQRHDHAGGRRRLPRRPDRRQPRRRQGGVADRPQRLRPDRGVPLLRRSHRQPRRRPRGPDQRLADGRGLRRLRRG